MKEFSDLVGVTLKDVIVDKDSAEISFVLEDDSYLLMYHEQSCCESVFIESIEGEVSDLIGTPILKAEEVWNNENPLTENGYTDDSCTWTFYHISTIKGTVTIRWFGTSNGYYSESVDFRFVKARGKIG